MFTQGPQSIAVTPRKHRYLQAAIVGFEVLATVSVKSRISWDATSYSLVKVHRRFGVICCFRLQGIRYVK
jgi:hypothetical protein